MRPAIVFLSSLALVGCATRPAPPANLAEAPFSLEQALAGPSTARGEFRAINGVRRGFTAALNGAMVGEEFVLTEAFAFDDGERDQKTWRLRQIGPGRWTGVREDVVGLAQGFQDGKVFRLEYEVVLPSTRGKPGRKVKFRDVMGLAPDGATLNAATVGYWGLRVAQVSIVIRPDPQTSSQTAAPAAMETADPTAK